MSFKVLAVELTRLKWKLNESKTACTEPKMSARPSTFISSELRLILAAQDAANCKQLYFLVTTEECSVPSAADCCKGPFPGWHFDVSSDACVSSVETPKGVKTTLFENLTTMVNDSKILSLMFSPFSGSVGDLSAPYSNDLKFWGLPPNLLIHIVLRAIWYTATQTKHQLAKGHCRLQCKVSC